MVLPLTFTQSVLDAEIGGDVGGHGGDVRGDFGRLGDHRGIHIAHPPASGTHRGQRATQQYAAIGAAQTLVAIGKHAADIAETRGAEQGVGDGVQQRVGVRVAVETGRMRDVHATEDQLAPGDQGVNVVTLADTKFTAHCGALRGGE